MAAGGDFPRPLAHESGPAGLKGYFAVIVMLYSAILSVQDTTKPTRAEREKILAMLPKAGGA